MSVDTTQEIIEQIAEVFCGALYGPGFDAFQEPEALDLVEQAFATTLPAIRTILSTPIKDTRPLPMSYEDMRPLPWWKRFVGRG